MRLMLVIDACVDNMHDKVTYGWGGGVGERFSWRLRIFFFGGMGWEIFGGWEFEKFSRVGVEKFKGGGGG